MSNRGQKFCRVWKEFAFGNDGIKGAAHYFSATMCNAKLLANAKQLFLLSFFYFLLLALLCYGVGELVKNSNSLSFRSLFLDEESMRPYQWLGSVLGVSFSALTLLVGCQEGHLAHNKNLYQSSRLELSRKKTEEEPSNSGSPGKLPLKW